MSLTSDDQYPMPETLGGIPVHRNGDGWLAHTFGGRSYATWEVHPTNALHWTAVINDSGGMPMVTVQHGRTPVLALAEALARAGSGALLAELAPVLREDHDAQYDTSVVARSARSH